MAQSYHVLHHIGYGGQARILSVLSKISKYCFIDLPDVLRLAEKYLSHFHMDMDCCYKTLNYVKDISQFQAVFI